MGRRGSRDSLPSTVLSLSLSRGSQPPPPQSHWSPAYWEMVPEAGARQAVTGFGQRPEVAVWSGRSSAPSGLDQWGPPGALRGDENLTTGETEIPADRAVCHSLSLTGSDSRALLLDSRLGRSLPPSRGWRNTGGCAGRGPWEACRRQADGGGDQSETTPLLQANLRLRSFPDRRMEAGACGSQRPRDSAPSGKLYDRRGRKLL